MKNELRRKIKIKRRYLGEIVRLEGDRAIFEEFFSALSGYESFFIYNSFGDEARTDIIIEELLNRGKKVYLPRVEGDKMYPVPYCGGELIKGCFGVFEPVGQAYAGGIEVAVIPLLAVNSRGYRLGYGGGYYDRFLKDRKIYKVGIGYGFQMEEFFEEPHDVPLDIYICERGIYDFGEE